MGLTIIGEIIVGIALIVFGFFVGSWKRQQRKHELYWMKIDCIIYAFRSVNHGIGTEFGKAYDYKFREMKKDNDFIENNSSE